MILALLACKADPEPIIYPDVADLPEQADPPDPFVAFDGTVYAGREDWEVQRVPEIRGLFEHYVYGIAAADPASVDVSELSSEGRVIELRVEYGAGPMFLALFLPDGAGPFPVILGLDKCGNHSITDAPSIALPAGFVDPACEDGRASQASAWAISEANARGYAVAAFHQSDVDPDDPDERGAGVRAELAVEADPELQWGSVAAWSWGLSRAVDALSERDDIDTERIFVFGHSRRGKAALWAAANDPRIDGVWAHQSGIAGQALARGSTGETVAAINQLYPHWFDDLFPEFGGNEPRLPIDQHELLALIAPRPIIAIDGDEDAWANPPGAEDAVERARAIYDLYDAGDAIEWQLRPGPHEVRVDDWERAMDFFDAR